MEEMDKKEFEKAKNLDPVFIIQLVKQIKNDTELGAAVRRYVLLNNNL